MNEYLHLRQENIAKNQGSACPSTHLLDVLLGEIRITTDELANMLNQTPRQALRTKREGLLDKREGLHQTLDALEETQTGKPYDTNPHDVLQAVWDVVLDWFSLVEDELAKVEDELAKEDQ